MQSGAAGGFSGSHNTRCPSLQRNLDRSWYPVHVQADAEARESQTARDSSARCQRPLGHFIRCYWLKMLSEDSSQHRV